MSPGTFLCQFPIIHQLSSHRAVIISYFSMFQKLLLAII